VDLYSKKGGQTFAERQVAASFLRKQPIFRRVMPVSTEGIVRNSEINS
jgi:hypothetical protein